MRHKRKNHIRSVKKIEQKYHKQLEKSINYLTLFFDAKMKTGILNEKIFSIESDLITYHLKKSVTK